MELAFERALLPDGLAQRVLIEVAPDGRIVRLERAADPERGPFKRGLALAGMPNLHSHAFQRAMAGSAEVATGAEGSFWGWRDVMYRFVDRLAPADLTAISALCYAEMVEAGYTAVAEFHYLHHDVDGSRYAVVTALADAVRQAARAAGIRHLLLPCLYQQGNFGGEPLLRAQRRFYNATGPFLELCAALAAGESPRERTGVALHSLRAVPPDALAAVAAYAKEGQRARPLHIHVAEQSREVDDCVAAYHQRPVEYLLDRGYPGPHWCLVHATHVNHAELAGIAATGAVVGLCPTTEANLGDGRFPLDELLAAGGRFGIGSDSQVSIDPREELRSAEYTLRLWRERRVIATSSRSPRAGTALWQAAVAGGAQALGYRSAGLAIGAPADVVLLDADRAEFAGLNEAALVDGFVFAPRPRAIAAVWVGGEQLVVDGRHRDRDAIDEAYAGCLARLRQTALE